jgi:peptidoglycan/xylan/chitin deacetylase (PgdA/CDA1 family)
MIVLGAAVAGTMMAGGGTGSRAGARTGADPGADAGTDAGTGSGSASGSTSAPGSASAPADADAALPCQPPAPHLRTPMLPPASNWFADHAAMLARTQPEFVHVEAPICDRRVALTFDDGPDRVNTPIVLDVLAERGVHATFFVVGHRVRSDPEIVQRMVDEGHTVGGHGDTHIDLRSLGAKVWERQIVPTHEALASIVADPIVFRPPYGALTAEQTALLGSKGLHTILWSVDSDDWRGSSTPEKIQEVVMAHVHAGAIILLHSDRAATAKALPALIDALTAEGYTMVTVTELLGLTP